MASANRETHAASIDRWMQGPFHALGIIDPALRWTAFGTHHDPSSRGFRYAAGLDVVRGRTGPRASRIVVYSTGKAIVGAYEGGEWPDPLTSCRGYRAPTGPPLLVQLRNAPAQVSPSVARNGVRIPSCVFHAATYQNPDAGTRSHARRVLAARNAVVVMSKAPLAAGATYTVTVRSRGYMQRWSFTY